MNINATNRILDRNFTILYIMKKHVNEVFNSTSEFFFNYFFSATTCTNWKNKN